MSRARVFTALEQATVAQRARSLIGRFFRDVFSLFQKGYSAFQLYDYHKILSSFVALKALHCNPCVSVADEGGINGALQLLHQMQSRTGLPLAAIVT